MACDPEALRQSIIRQFAASSVCAEQLPDIIPAFWELSATEACYNDYIRSLIVRREAVMFLMGCEVYSVDEYQMHYRMDDNRVADTIAHFRSQAQGTGNSTKFALGHGETRYDETNTARSRGDMVRHSRGTHTGDGRSEYRDDGKGNGFNNSDSFNSIDADTTGFDDKFLRAIGRERGSRSDCNYEYSQNNSVGEGFLVAIVSASATTNASDWRKFTRNASSDEDSSQSDALHSGETHTVDDRRGRGTHDWLSQFLADVEWFDKDFDIRILRDRSDTRRHAEAHAQGSGDGLSEEKIEGHNAAQSTLKITGESNTLRTHSRVWNRTLTNLAHSQRFRNLRLIYQQLTDQIAFYKRRLRQRCGPAVGQLPCHCTSRCSCGPSNLASRCGLSLHHQAMISTASEAIEWLQH